LKDICGIELQLTASKNIPIIKRRFFVIFINYEVFWVPLRLLGPPFFPIILFGSTTLLTGKTGISLHMQWPLTSQLHGIDYEVYKNK
jgi:hypothetical protein